MIPVNPFCRIVRQLSLSNMEMDLKYQLQNIPKEIQLTESVGLNNFGISFVGDKKLKLFGFQQILEFINMANFKISYESINTVIPKRTKV